MLAGLLVSLVLLAAPEDEAAAKLRAAWASQYEWKEDGVKNITLDFEYTGVWKGRDNEEYSYRGTGQLVVADGKVVRRHMPDINPAQREQLETELDWVVARFARAPFDEVFKGATFGETSDLAGEVLKIPVDGVAYLVKADRLVGKERNIGTADKPFVVRTDYVPATIGNGYGIVEERTSYTRAMVKSLEVRTLTLRANEAPPAPERHVLDTTVAAGSLHLEIVFKKPRVNAADPVVLDAAARDRLKKAWARQYRLPRDIRIEGTFDRKLSRDLARARWTPNVKGKFQVWGLDSIEAVVKGNTGGARVQDSCLSHLRWAFGLFDVKPFDQEFAGCGFTVEERAEGDAIIHVIGHRDVLAFRVADGLIVGRLETGTGQSWWDYEVKATRDGPALIESMTREVNGRKHELNFRYTKVGGELVPKSVAALGTPSSGDSPNLVFGVAEYRFSRLKVSRPK